MVITQGKDKHFIMCAIGGWPLTNAQRNVSYIERVLLFAIWAYKRVGRYTYYLTTTTIELLSPAKIHITMCEQQLPPRLQAKLFELTLLQCKC